MCHEQWALTVIKLLRFLTRHSLVERRARYLFYCMFVCLFVCLFGQRFLSNAPADSRHILHAGVAWVGTCLLPFWGLAAPGGRKKRQMKFSLVWESMGNFCILAVFERYLSNACTNPHQILFVYGQCLPTCPLPCAHSGIEPSTLAKGFLQGGPTIRIFDHF